MTDEARHPEEPEISAPRRDPFGLEAYLERQAAEFTDGPTMTEILDDMDRYRHPAAPGGESVTDSLHAVRREREEHLDELWRG
ncbi:hypothetical protein [Amycolatopsis nigrescens]|uniref:hypothetical protein n=1 Tax=Amycolatopsis nigrescens TaxID=381445 RepID=UPI00035C3232|nr:hypothetical protein [Amycolatopsis nigrescens]